MTTIRIDLHVHMNVYTQTYNDVAKYLLNAAELLSNEPTLRYDTDVRCGLQLFPMNYIMKQRHQYSPSRRRHSTIARHLCEPDALQD